MCEVVLLRGKITTLSDQFIAPSLQAHHVGGRRVRLRGATLAQRALHFRFGGGDVGRQLRLALLVRDAPCLRGGVIASGRMQAVVDRSDLAVQQAFGTFTKHRFSDTLHAVLDALEQALQCVRHQALAFCATRR